jgi:hypothetical protein
MFTTKKTFYCVKKNQWLGKEKGGDLITKHVNVTPNNKYII